jgi:hypothetical protein
MPVCAICWHHWQLPITYVCISRPLCLAVITRYPIRILKTMLQPVKRMGVQHWSASPGRCAHSHHCVRRDSERTGRGRRPRCDSLDGYLLCHTPTYANAQALKCIRASDVGLQSPSKCQASNWTQPVGGGGGQVPVLVVSSREPEVTWLPSTPELCSPSFHRFTAVKSTTAV